jgi:hypothetical protein
VQPNSITRPSHPFADLWGPPGSRLLRAGRFSVSHCQAGPVRQPGRLTLLFPAWLTGGTCLSSLSLPPSSLCLFRIRANDCRIPRGLCQQREVRESGARTHRSAGPCEQASRGRTPSSSRAQQSPSNRIAAAPPHAARKSRWRSNQRVRVLGYKALVAVDSFAHPLFRPSPTSLSAIAVGRGNRAGG